MTVAMNPTVDRTEDLRRLAELATRPSALPDVLEHALHSLRTVIAYDLAVLYTLDGDRLVAEAAAGPLADDRVRAHSIDLARLPTVRRAMQTRRPIPLEPHDHATEGDPYDGVLDLPHGHACMVVPLFADGRDLGIITLDRKVCAAYSPEDIAIAGTYGQIVSLALAFAGQAAELRRYRDRLEEHNRLLRNEVGRQDQAVARIESSASPRMRELAAQAQQVAAAGLPVLIDGETGVGKEVLAQAIHAWSRREGAFVKLNCAAIPAELVESELFGHVRGAFSGATRDRPGRFATADGGTLLLDEVGDMPLAAQAKLLRVLQEGAFEPVGSDETVRVDVRIIAASHVDLETATGRGDFREDLFYRLAVFPLHMPSLRERPEDIASLARSILDDLGRQHGRGPWSLTPAALSALQSQPWPGNVRQLVNVLERATILQPSGEIDVTHLVLDAVARRGGIVAAVDGSPHLVTLHDAIRSHLLAALDATGGKIYGPDGAARLLDVKPTTLQSKLKRHGITRAR
jgi:transcriptional regulator with GAF, ATPase, and Fis domain